MEEGEGGGGEGKVVTGNDAEPRPPLLGGFPAAPAEDVAPSTPSFDEVDLLEGFRRNLETRWKR